MSRDHSDDLTISIPGRTGPDKEGDETFTTTGSPRRSAPSMPDSIGPYRILGVLGEGGMGVVYEAEQLHPQRRVAVKVMRQGHRVDEVHSRLFHREAETLGRLEHPNIAAIYQAGHTEDGCDYFAMELARGQTLDRWLRDRPQPVTPAELELRLRLFKTLAEAVHYAHQRGVIHRDLKPTNIVVTEPTSSSGSGSASFPTIKILDFGLARITDADVKAVSILTEAGMIRGTLPYMAPEQARGEAEAIDIRTDVYALGVVLYEMLTGVRPYDTKRAALVEVIRVICEEPPVPLSNVWAGLKRLDPDVETIVAKALAKEPEYRYASASALSEDVERYLSSQPIMARPPSAGYQIRKFIRRNRALTAAASISIAALATSAVISTLFALGEARQRRTAEQAQSELEAVVQFQTNALRRVDPAAMGRDLLADLSGSVGAALTTAGHDQGAVNAAITELESLLGHLNATDLARRLIDTNILEPAEQAMTEELAARPAIEARLRRAAGSTYSSLGMPEKALEQLERTLELRRVALGADDPETLRSAAQLGVAQWKMGQWKVAEATLSETIDGMIRVLGDDHNDTAQARMCLGVVFMSDQRNDEALTLFHEVLAAQEASLGPDHEDVALTLANLATALTNLDRHAEARPLLERVLEIRRREFGEDHASTQTALRRLAEVLQHVGEGERAVAMLRDAIAALAELKGAEHPDTLTARQELMDVLKNESRFPEAEAEARGIIDARTRALGANHPDTLSSMDQLAILYSNMGREDEAERLFVDCLERTRATFGAEHRKTLDRVTNLAVSYWYQGRFEETGNLFREVLRASRASYGDEHLETAYAMSNLGVLLTHTGELDEAEELHQRALELRTEQLGPDHPMSLVSKAGLATIWFEREQFAEVAPLLAELVEGRTASLGANHTLTMESMFNLAITWRRLEREAEAQELLQKTLDLRREVLGPTHPQTLLTIEELASMHEDGGRLDLARPLVEEVVATRLAAALDEDASPAELESCAALLLASPFDDLRDPARALQLALRAVELTEHRDAHFLSTLAQAYHATGEPQLAASTQRVALDLLPADAPARKDFLDRLTEYSSGHSPPELSKSAG